VLNKILKGAGTDAIKYFPVRLVPALTSFITVPIFTRMIAPADYGDFYLVNSAVSLTATLLTSWLTASIVRFYWAEEREGRLDEYVATVVWSAIVSLFIGSLLVGGLGYLFAGNFSAGVQRLLPIALAGLIFNQFIQVIQQLMRAANRTKAYSVLSVASAILATVFSVFFVVVPKWGAYGVLAGVVLGNALLVPFAIRNAHSEGSLSPRRYSRDIARQFASYGVPMIPAAVSSWILVLSDRYIIGLSQSAEQVGLYGAAYGLGDKIMNLMMTPVLIAIGPVMVRTFEKHDQHLAEEVQTQLTRYFAMLTVPLVAGLAVIAEPFMAVFTGPAYREAYKVLPIVAAGVMLYGMTQIAGNGLSMHKKTLVTMQNVMMAAAFQVGMNLWLIPRFGYTAAAWNTLLSYLLLLTLAWWRSKPYMEWKLPVLDLARIVGASVIMAAVLIASFRWFEPAIWLLFAEAALGLAVYLVALWALRGLRAEELKFVRQIWAAIKRRLGFSKPA